MKKPILTFLFVFILFGGMSSSADNAMSDLISESGSEVSLVSLSVTTSTNDATTAPAPNSATILLIATGLIGLAGVSNRKKS